MSTLPAYGRAAWAQIFVEINRVGRFACHYKGACKHQLRGTSCRASCEVIPLWTHSSRESNAKK